MSDLPDEIWAHRAPEDGIGEWVPAHDATFVMYLGPGYEITPTRYIRADIDADIRKALAEALYEYDEALQRQDEGLANVWLDYVLKAARAYLSQPEGAK